MLYTKQTAKDNVRNRDGKRVIYLGKDDRLTSEAKDFLSAERIQILSAEEARPARYSLLSGGFTEEKPEHMTHLNGDVLVPKTHPRIRFRGTMDTLEAEIMLCQLKAPQWNKALGEVLALARRLIRCEVLDEPVGEFTLCGLSEQQQRQRSHFPQDFYGQPHFMPEVTDGETVLWLNRARCAARSAELTAAEAFADRDGNPTRLDILRALNRMSSMLYILMIQQKGNPQRSEYDGY